MADLSTTSAAYDELKKKYDTVENSDYESKYDADISKAVDVIKNAEDFNYDSGKDASYQAAKRQYEKGANQAMKNTLASSAALTGGYNNSWGQTAAQQAYDDIMRDVASTLLPQYEEKAYARHQDKINQNYNLVSLLSGLDDRDYARYSDDLAKEQALLNLAASIYDTNRGYDYQKERDAYNDALNERSIAAQEALAAAEAASANALANGDYDAALKAYQNGGKNGLKKHLESSGYSTDDATKLIEYATSNYMSVSADWGENGKIKWVTDETGVKKTTWHVDGEYRTLEKGVNPYTMTVNSDIENGSFENGYQPDNYKGKKLSKAEGEKVEVYGRSQQVWKTEDGNRYVWIGRDNKYITMDKYNKTYQ